MLCVLLAFCGLAYLHSSLPSLPSSSSESSIRLMYSRLPTAPTQREEGVCVCVYVCECDGAQLTDRQIQALLAYMGGS